MHRVACASALRALCVVLALLAGCSRSEEKTASVAPPPPAPAAVPAPAAPQAVPFRVVRVDLGNAVDGAKKVAAPTATFKPGDTIYASIVTEGASQNVLLLARWTYEDGQVVNEAQQTIAPTGPAATEFHISKPDGWPAGKYQVAIAANGLPAGTKEFTVVD
jgi:hypothetical protein